MAVMYREKLCNQPHGPAVEWILPRSETSPSLKLFKQRLGGHPSGREKQRRIRPDGLSLIPLFQTSESEDLKNP